MQIIENYLMNKKKLPDFTVGISLDSTLVRKREIDKNLIKLRQNDKSWLAYGYRQTSL